MSPFADERWMRLALRLGERGLGRVWPNPAVGCVIVKNNLLIGRGWTQAGGRPHAETMALAQAGDRAKGSTVYVSLEPCAHHGKTPPCVDGLINAGVRRVVSAMQDPDIRVSGRGHKALSKAGVTVDVGLLADLAIRSHQGFIHRITKQRPFVCLKLASSLDGKIASGNGQSKWITGKQAREFVHLMRSRHDAILIGRSTAVTDDPSLTVRGSGLDNIHPLRVVLDTKLTTPLQSKLGKTARAYPVALLHTDMVKPDRIDAWNDLGANTIKCETNKDGRVDLGDALRKLANLGVTRLLCEGGAEVAASLVKLGLADQLVLFTAGLVIGQEGRSNIGALGLNQLSLAAGFHLTDHHVLGADLMSLWRPKLPPHP